jgi:hypothetical protein
MIPSMKKKNLLKDIQEMDDDTLQSLLASIPEEEIKKFRCVCSRVQAKAKPVKEMVDGKDRSISPAAVINTKLNPTIVNSGRDRKIAE